MKKVAVVAVSPDTGGDKSTQEKDRVFHPYGVASSIFMHFMANNECKIKNVEIVRSVHRACRR